MKVCSQPMIVSLERAGYASQEATISDGSTVTLLCGKAWALYKPHTVQLMNTRIGRNMFKYVGQLKKYVHYYHDIKVT